MYQLYKKNLPRFVEDMKKTHFGFLFFLHTVLENSLIYIFHCFLSSSAMLILALTILAFHMYFLWKTKITRNAATWESCSYALIWWCT